MSPVSFHLDDHHHHHQRLLVPSSRSSSVTEAPLAMFYSDPSMTPCSSSSSGSSFNIRSNSNDLSPSSSSSISFFNDMSETNKTLSSSSSGYESNIPTSNSSFNSLPDHLYLSSPDSLKMPPPSSIPSSRLSANNDCNLVEQFIDLHLQKQPIFDQDAAYSPPSSFSSSSSSCPSQAAASVGNSPV